MPLWTCEQCGAQFPESAEPPQACPVCEDERQFVNWKGQAWLTREELAKRYKLVWRDDLDIPGISISRVLRSGSARCWCPRPMAA